MRGSRHRKKKALVGISLTRAYWRGMCLIHQKMGQLFGSPHQYVPIWQSYLAPGNGTFLSEAITTDNSPAKLYANLCLDVQPGIVRMMR